MAERQPLISLDAEATALAAAARDWITHGLAGDVHLAVAILCALRLLMRALAWLVLDRGCFAPARAI